MRQISVIERDSDGNYTYYCRQCGKYYTQADWPIMCTECGNIEIVEGWGVSGDGGTSNTTDTISRNQPGGNYLAAGTIDKPRG